MLRKVTHCAGRVSANARPHQLCWGDWEMGTAISCTECSQVAGLIQNLVETPRSACFSTLLIEWYFPFKAFLSSTFLISHFLPSPSFDYFPFPSLSPLFQGVPDRCGHPTREAAVPKHESGHLCRSLPAREPDGVYSGIPAEIPATR